MKMLALDAKGSAGLCDDVPSGLDRVSQALTDPFRQLALVARTR
jgi:hypothetical protein